MSGLIAFLIRYKNSLLFLLLLIIGLSLTVQTHSYQRSKVVNSANSVTGRLFTWRNSVSSYLHLKRENALLADENRVLREKLLNLTEIGKHTHMVDSLNFETGFKVFNAEVISNNYSGIDNYILIDKGAADGINEELGVLTGRGIVGVVEKTGNRFSRVISILNSKLPVNAQLKNSGHYGTLIWDGKDPNRVRLIEVPRQAVVSEGDTIITNGKSMIFPKGIPIGTVTRYNMDSSDNYFELEVELFNDMTNIGTVYIIQNLNIEEFKELNQESE